MVKTIEKGFFKNYFIDLIEPMYEENEKGKVCIFTDKPMTVFMYGLV